MLRVRLLSHSFHIFLEPRSLARVHLTLHAYKCSAESYCIWAFGHTILFFLFTICAQYSPSTSWACSNTLTILLVFEILWICLACVIFRLSTGISEASDSFSCLLLRTPVWPVSGLFFGLFGDIIFVWKHAVYIMERFLNLRVKRIIHFGSVVLSVLVYRHWFLPVLAFTGKLPYSGAYLKTRVSQGKLWSLYCWGVFRYRFLPLLFKTRCASKKHSKRKLQTLNADFSPQFLMRPAGLSWFKIMRPLWESCVWDAGRAGKKNTEWDPFLHPKMSGPIRFWYML